MSKHICPTCNREFGKISHLKDHLTKKKKPCVLKMDYKHQKTIDFHPKHIENDKNDKNDKKIIINEINPLTCRYCKLTVSRKDVLTKHINKHCKVKKNLDNEKENVFKLLLEKEEIINKKEKENEELKQLIKDQNKKIINEINKINNTTINNQLLNLISDKDKKIEELVNNTNIIVTNKVNENKPNIKIDNDNKSLVLNNIVILSRKEDNYINATQLCKAGNKKFSHWISLDTTKELINELTNDICIKTSQINNISNSSNYFIKKSYAIADAGIPASASCDIVKIKSDIFNTGIMVLNKSNTVPDAGFPVSATCNIYNVELVQINKGGNKKNNQNTWIHPDLAIQLAQWLSPKFALLVSRWIRTLVIEGNVQLKNSYENELVLKDKKIKILEDVYLKKHKRTTFNDENVIYILTTEDNKKKRIYIVGKSKNLKTRLSTYNKTAEHEVVYYKSCKNEKQMDFIETLVIKKLEIYKEKANRDRFILPIDKDISLFKTIIDKSIIFFEN
jgi:hypothetical protein